MAKPNALAAALAENKRLREYAQYLEALCRVIQQWTGQLCDDLITVVLADSEVMGKDTFGPARITKINARRNELWERGVRRATTGAASLVLFIR